MDNDLVFYAKQSTTDAPKIDKCIDEINIEALSDSITQRLTQK